MYTYNASLIEVVDGDTVKLDIDLGFTVHVKVKVRLRGINAPEKRGETKAAGLEAKEALKTLLENKPIRLTSHKAPVTESFGRWLGTLSVPVDATGQFININQWLIDNGYAVPFMVEKL
jgi:micrococcal nuclease